MNKIEQLLAYSRALAELQNLLTQVTNRIEKEALQKDIQYFSQAIRNAEVKIKVHESIVVSFLSIDGIQKMPGVPFVSVWLVGSCYPIHIANNAVHPELQMAMENKLVKIFDVK